VVSVKIYSKTFRMQWLRDKFLECLVYRQSDHQVVEVGQKRRKKTRERRSEAASTLQIEALYHASFQWERKSIFEWSSPTCSGYIHVLFQMRPAWTRVSCIFQSNQFISCKWAVQQRVCIQPKGEWVLSQLRAIRNLHDSIGIKSVQKQREGWNRKSASRVHHSQTRKELVPRESGSRHFLAVAFSSKNLQFLEIQESRRSDPSLWPRCVGYGGGICWLYSKW